MRLVYQTPSSYVCGWKIHHMQQLGCIYRDVGVLTLTIGTFLHTSTYREAKHLMETFE